MPKLAAEKRMAARKRDPVFELLLGRKAALHMSDRAFGALLGWSPSVTCNRLKNSTCMDWSYSEIVTLADKLNVPLDDFRAAVRY